jgi:hypothetical protein
VKYATSDVSNLDWVDAEVDCSSGKHVLGGGLWIDNENVHILKDQPLLTGDGWHILAHNTDLFSKASVTAFAVCANT